MNLPRNETPQCLDGQKEVLARADLVLMIGREPSTRDQAVNMGMEQQVLTPGMQNGNQADLSAESIRVGCHLKC